MKWSQPDCIDYVNSYVSDWFETKPASDYHWEFVPMFEVELIYPKIEWIEWMNREINYVTKAGLIDYYSDILSEEIINPAIVLHEKGHYTALDGNHRMGATVLRGGNNVKALIGKPL
jgi:hypothetical protein